MAVAITCKLPVKQCRYNVLGRGDTADANFLGKDWDF